MKKHYILTHSDLDGLACVINIVNYLPIQTTEFQYKPCGYNYLTKIVKDLEREEFDCLWITDINLTEEQLKVVLSYGKPTYHFDHHVYEYNPRKYEASHTNYTFCHSEDKCAALLLNENLQKYSPKRLRNVEAVEKLSLFTDAYDRWLKDDKFNVGYGLNDLYWEYGYEKFFNKFRNGFKLDVEDRTTLIRISKERNDYVKDSLANHSIINEEYKLVYIFNSLGLHINHFTLNDKYNAYVILKEVNDKEVFTYSVRLRNAINLTIQEIFGKIKESEIEVLTAGGHKTVGSITIKQSQNSEFLELINKILEEAHG